MSDLKAARVVGAMVAVLASCGEPERNIMTPGNSWTLDVVWIVGGGEAEGPMAFGGPRVVAVDAADRAWVLDAMAHHVVVLDANGALVRTVAREGQGPGELLSPIGIGITRDQEVWVPDPDNLRFTVFDTVGHLVATYRRTASCRTPVWRGGVLTDGRVLDVTCRTREGRREYVLATYDRVLEDLRDTIGIPRPTAPEAGESTFRFPGVTIVIPFIPEVLWHLTGQGTVWTGWAGRYLILQFTLNGDTLALARRVVAPTPVPARQRDSALARVRRYASGAQFDESRIPEGFPVFEALTTSDGGDLWDRAIKPQPTKPPASATRTSTLGGTLPGDPLLAP